MKNFASVLLALSVCLALPGVGYAQQAQANLYIWATVYPVGQIETSPVNFTVFSGEEGTATGDIRVRVTGGVLYWITLNSGENYDGMTRRVKDSQGNFMPYQLFQDSSLTTEWGDDNATYPASSLTDTGTGFWRSHPVYGRIVAPANIPVYSYYDDIVVATLYF